MSLNSGDIGYCRYKQSMIGLLVTWDDLDGKTVVAVDCDHDVCSYAPQCELYNRRPVGFTFKPQATAH